MHTILTLDSAYKHTVNALSQVHGKDEALRMAELLFEDVFGIDKIKRLTASDKSFNDEQRLYHLLDRLSKGEPYQHVIGYTLFCNRRILVSGSVLIPRPETEELFYWMKSKVDRQVKTMADICTGSGCLAIAMRDNFRQADIIACDVSIEALSKAALSERLNFIANRIEWEVMDILEADWQYEWPQVVVSNPPYILKDEASEMSQTVLDYEPHIALFAKGKDPLIFYKRIIEVFNKPNMPEIYFELNPLTADDLCRHCHQMGLYIETAKDMSGKTRFARVSRMV